MKNKTVEWTKFFSKMFREWKKAILKHYKLEADGSGPSEILAIRDVVTKFPCAVRIAEIKIDTEKHKHIEDEVCQIIRYDFAKLGAEDRTLKYYGIVDAKNSEELKELLVKNFDLNKKLFKDFYKDFKTIGWYDNNSSYTQFALYNIKEKPQKFVFDFSSFVFRFLEEKIVKETAKGIDWNKTHSLKSDPIMSISELTKMDDTLNAFMPFSKGAGIEKLQEDICDIQLIPSVPETVKRVFRYAKDLHIYAFFRYNFFTIAQHYAYLALESAIKIRYYQSFGKENTLENEKGETLRTGRIDHQKIIDICRRRKGWDFRKLKINGEKFAFRQGELHKWLVKRGIITMWERKPCERGMRLRNIMSHLTHTYVFPPAYSVQALEFVADIINKLYSIAGPATDINSKSVFRVDLTPSGVQ
jgi:hypothetical protein